MEKTDSILFAAENGASTTSATSCDAHRVPWKILVIDDEEEVLSITKFVLRKFTFEERPVELLCGHSGADARRLVQQHPDAAIILLDVVMEVDNAGLDVVRYIRDEFKNPFIRIILRTGQPGHAPEEQVFDQYEINDYKDKAFLTGQNLTTSIKAALRSYRDLRAMENMRKGLTKIIDATADLFEPSSLKILASGILTQITTIIGSTHSGTEHHSIQDTTSCLAFSNRRGEMLVYAGSGRFEQSVGTPLARVVSPETLTRLQGFIAEKKCYFFDTSYFGYFCASDGTENFIYMEGTQPIGVVEKSLLEIFSTNIAFAFDKLFLNREVLNTQRDVTFTLGEVIEVRSQEAGNHVRRVALFSRLLAKKCGFDDAQADLLFAASPLHDLGKIGIPDHILNKPGQLDQAERTIMEGHTTIGYTILKRTERSILQAGAIIALQHHEKWDGSGYPAGLQGEQIHIFARVTAIADVFDALISDRCYRKAWDLARVLALLKEERSKHFDPQLVDAFFDNLDEMIGIRDNLQD